MFTPSAAARTGNSSIAGSDCIGGHGGGCGLGYGFAEKGHPVKLGTAGYDLKVNSQPRSKQIDRALEGRFWVGFETTINRSSHSHFLVPRTHQCTWLLWGVGLSGLVALGVTNIVVFTFAFDDHPTLDDVSRQSA